MANLRGNTAIVATAESDLGKVAAATSIFDLMGQATNRALDDCGLSLSDIDGLFVSTSPSRMAARGVSEYRGLRPRGRDWFRSQLHSFPQADSSRTSL